MPRSTRENEMTTTPRPASCSESHCAFVQEDYRLSEGLIHHETVTDITFHPAQSAGYETKLLPSTRTRHAATLEQSFSPRAQPMSQTFQTSHLISREVCSSTVVAISHKPATALKSRPSQRRSSKRELNISLKSMCWSWEEDLRLLKYRTSPSDGASQRFTTSCAVPVGSSHSTWT
jgi:hypothetical protein